MDSSDEMHEPLHPEFPQSSPLHLAHPLSKQIYFWSDYDEIEKNVKNHNIIGLLYLYETIVTSKANFTQKFTIAQPGKNGCVKIVILVFSDDESDMPIPSRKGQIIYFRDCFKIHDNPHPTFVISKSFPKWRCIILGSEEKAKKYHHFAHPNGILYTDGGGFWGDSRKSAIGQKFP